MDMWSTDILNISAHKIAPSGAEASEGVVQMLTGVPVWADVWSYASPPSHMASCEERKPTASCGEKQNSSLEAETVTTEEIVEPALVQLVAFLMFR